MNIEEIKRNRFKRFTLIMLLVFTIIMILGAKNSICASEIQIRSISNNYLWKVQSSDTDYELANVVYATMQFGSDGDVSKLKNQNEPANNKLKPGYLIGSTGGNENTFNWRATIGCVSDSSRFCQMVCIHPSTSLDTTASTTYVQKVLFISKDQLTLYYTDSLSTVSVKKESKSTGTNSAYFNKILQEAYKAKGSVVAAEHLRHHLADDEFHRKIRDCGMTNWELMAGNNFSTSCSSSDDGFNYYGIFIFVGTGGIGSQGRIIFNVCREPNEKPVEVNFKKTDMDGTSISGAQIKIECGDNAKFSGSTSTSTTKTVGSDTKVTIAPINYNLGSFKLKISETTAPTSHAKFNGTITVTVNYNTSNGTVTSITSDNTTYIPNISSNTVTIKNQYISPIVIGGDNGGFNKVDQAGNPISGARFKAVFTQGGSPIATKYANSAESGKLSFAQVQPTTTANVTVTITEISAPTGYVNSGFSKTIEFKYNTATKTWEPVNDSTVSVKYESKKTFVKLEDVVNESRIEELEILKQDSVNGSTLSGAKFKITLENVKSVKGYSSSGSGTQVLNGVTTNTQGKIVLKEIVIKDAAQDVIITIEETESPNGYKKIDGKIIIVITRTGTQYKIVRYKDNTVLDEEFVATVIDETGRVPGDVSGNGLVNSGDALLVLQYTMGLLDSSERAKVEENGDLNGDGRITSEDADLILQYSVGLVSSNSDSVYFEKIANGERGDADSDGQITANDALAVLKYSTNLATPNNAQRTQSDVNEDGNVNSSDALIILKYLQYENGRVVEGENVTDHKISLTIKDIPGIQELVMNKADSQNGNPVAGAEFEVSFGNVRSVNGTNYTAGTKIKTTTNADGHFDPKIEKIIAQNVNAPIKIYITETKAPIGYKKIEGTITLEVSRVDGKYKVTRAYADESVITPDEFNSEGLSNSELDNNYLYLNINNIPVMNLGGIVWEDTQSGEKLITGPDGIYNNGEQGMPNIEVKLFKGDNEITTNIYGETLMNRTSEGDKTLEYKLYNGEIDTITLSKGQYIFANIERGEDYKVQFTYDGINYKTVPISENCYANNKQSKVNEIDRAGFNDRFKTISPGQSNDGTTLEYEYSGDEKTSSLITMDGNTVLDKYQMKAESVNYLERGKAEADWKGTWTNDGKINTTHYALDVNCGLTYKFFDLALGTDVKEAKVSINSQETTYTYADIMDGALEDLRLDGIVQNKSNQDESQRYNLYLYESDYNYRIEDYNDGIDNPLNDEEYNSGDDEELAPLNVDVTYTVILKNQSNWNATVEEFVYYYDEVYTPKDITDTDDYSVSIDEENRKITFTSKEEGLNVNPGSYRKVIDLTFSVNKDAEDYIITKDNVTNITEITTYSTTEGGLIDCDSAPGNGIENGQITKYEDDTDEANGINIKVNRENPRIIAGTVWDDGKFNDADGLNNEENKSVNDVIVQLIEIKNISGKYYEYIWQQTRSGSSEVDTIKRHGYLETTYTNDVGSGSGSYKFEGFIPGNYIIRFIYGDGTTYDLTDNVKTYNGQDYKSTIDPNYNVTWYNNASYYTDSKARDNEARRLEVMSYSTTIDKAIGESLEKREKADLENTWMCAETSRIYIAVDTDDLSSTDGTQTATESGQGITFSDVNFGLALRPQTKLELEKHITGLKITPNGVGVQPIIDATADIGAILSGGETVATSGITTGLAAMKSDRDNRNFWKVETDIEELAQGAELEVEYTYVIKNDSDEDYLNRALIGQYEGNIDEYSRYLLNIVKPEGENLKNNIKGKTHTYGTYLGQWYYTRSKAENDEKVSSRIETLEEALNNDLKFVDTDSDYFNIMDTTNKNRTVFDTNGAEQTKEINTIVRTDSETEFLTPSETNEEGNKVYTYSDDIKTVDYNKTIKLTTVLSSSSNGEGGANLPSYIAEIVKYSNAAGRRDMESEPENLSYVHSDDTEMKLNNSWLYEIQNEDGTTTTCETQDRDSIPPEVALNIREANEDDEFWGETIIITKPTGENKQTGIQIAIITTSAVALLGVGIVLIKKFVLKK